MAPYILFTGPLNDLLKIRILGIYPTKSEAENAGKDYLESHSNTEVNIFEWESGFKSQLIVDIDRLWASNYEAPVQPATETIALPAEDSSHDQ